jgi:hypothetical protein
MQSQEKLPKLTFSQMSQHQPCSDLKFDICQHSSANSMALRLRTFVWQLFYSCEVASTWFNLVWALWVMSLSSSLSWLLNKNATLSSGLSWLLNKNATFEKRLLNHAGYGSVPAPSLEHTNSLDLDYLFYLSGEAKDIQDICCTESWSWIQLSSSRAILWRWYR